MREERSLNGLISKEELEDLLSSTPEERGADPASAGGADRERLAFRHWERTIRELEREIVELRTRVSRLESERASGETTMSAEALRAPAAAGPTAASATAAAEAAREEMREEAEPPRLSRVERLKGKRGWF